MMVRGIPLVRPAIRGTLLMLACLSALAGSARAVDVSQLSDFENSPCFKAVAERNTAQKVDIPDSAMADACDAVHGDADAAWARLMQMWAPRSSLGSSTPASAGGPGSVALALVGMALVYAVLGNPMRAVAGLMGKSEGQPTATLSVEALLALILRGLLGLVLLAILSLPYATAFGSVVLVVLLVGQTRPPRAKVRVPDLSVADPPPTAFSVILADLINDVAASAIGLFGLALLARHDPQLFGVAIILATVASVPGLIVLRRRLRRDALALPAAAAVLAAIFGVVATSDPRLVQAFGGATLPSLLVPLLFGAAVIGAVWTGRRARPA